MYKIERSQDSDIIIVTSKISKLKNGKNARYLYRHPDGKKATTDFINKLIIESNSGIPSIKIEEVLESEGWLTISDLKKLDFNRLTTENKNKDLSKFFGKVGMSIISVVFIGLFSLFNLKWGLAVSSGIILAIFIILIINKEFFSSERAQINWVGRLWIFILLSTLFSLLVIFLGLGIKELKGMTAVFMSILVIYYFLKVKKEINKIYEDLK